MLGGAFTAVSPRLHVDPVCRRAKPAVLLRAYRCSPVSGRMRLQEVANMRRELVAKEVLPAEPKKGK